MRRFERYYDIATLVIGAGLFVSPWVLGYGAVVPNLANQIAVVLGAIIAVSSIAALIAFEVWELYIVVAFAIASIASPWLLGISDAVATLTLVLAGVLALATSSAHLLVARRRFNAAINQFARKHSGSTVTGSQTVTNIGRYSSRKTKSGRRHDLNLNSRAIGS